MLYVWARAVAFAAINDAELHVSSWSRLRLGPLLRLERSKRLYLGSFRRDPLATRMRLLALRATRTPICDPPLCSVARHEAATVLYVFDRLGGEPSDPFRDLIPYRSTIIASFHAMLADRMRVRLDGLESPVIGIHVRRGDFNRSAWFTPIEHFCDRLRALREVAGCELPATVFSDGSDEELAPLLAMPGVRRSGEQPDVIDLVMLSRSRIILPSRASTFGMLAGFLSDAVIVRDPDWNHGDSRPPEINGRHFEGAPGMDPARWPSLLVRNLRECC
jgi:hypothetical protein